MTEEHKQELIDWLKEGIELREEYGFNGNLLASMRIALFALTAQPVKRPKNIGPSYAAVALSTRDEQWYDAIAEAGYEVQE